MAVPVDALLKDQLNERRTRLETALEAIPGDEQVRRLLHQVDAALARMDGGSYGICLECQESVEPERLVADPLMEYCLDHLTASQREALQRDLELAARVMRGLLPPASLTAQGYEIARHYEGAGPVSGDYVDAVEAGDGLYFAVGDVSGKGVAASMLMSHLHATLRALVPQALPLDQLVGRASALFCDSALPSHFATLVIGRAARTGEIELSNAGHVPPLLLRGGKVERIAPNGIPIGMFCGTRFGVTRLRLAPGDALFLYTDGLNEARDASGREYGIDRLVGLLSAGAGRTSPDLVASVLRDLDGFTARAPRTDDVTLMAVRRVA